MREGGKGGVEWLRQGQGERGGGRKGQVSDP